MPIAASNTESHDAFTFRAFDRTRRSAFCSAEAVEEIAMANHTLNDLLKRLIISAAFILSDWLKFQTGDFLRTSKTVMTRTSQSGSSNLITDHIAVPKPGATDVIEAA